MQTTITVKEKSVYGNTLIYPACEQSERFARLLNKKTFSGTDIHGIEGLGFTVNVIKLPA